MPAPTPVSLLNSQNTVDATTPGIDPAQATPAVDPAAVVAPQQLTDLIAQNQQQASSGVTDTTGQTVDTTGLDTSAIIPNLPSARKAFITKYQTLTPALANVNPGIKASLVNFDLQRVNKGQYPLSDKQTLAALTSAATHRAFTPAAKDTSILGRIEHIPGSIVSDLGTTLKGIGQLLEPNRGNVLYKEIVQNIPHWYDHYQANIKSGMNPVAAFAASPGIRFIPGSFIVGNLAQGGKGIGSLIDHPLITALDALPYASAAAKGTEVGAIAAEEAKAGTAVANAGEAVNPIRAVLTRKLLPEGETTPLGSQLTPNKLGEATQAVAQTKLGQFVTGAIGPKARILARITGRADQGFADVLNGNVGAEKWGPVARAYQLAAGDAVKDFGVDAQRASEIGDQLQIGENGHAFIDTLPTNEAAFARHMLELRRQFDGLTATSPDLGIANGEIYPIDQANRINKSATKAASGLDNLRTTILPRIDTMLANAHDASYLLDDKSVARLTQLRDDLTNALDPNHPATLKDVVKDINRAKQSRVAYGASTTGEAEGPAANVRIDSLNSIEKDIRGAVKAGTKADKAALLPPARFHTLIQQLAADKIKGYLVDAGADPQAAIDTVLERNFEAYPDVFNRDVLRSTTSDIAKTWRDLRDQGYDPMFVHRVTPARESLLRFPKVSDFVAEPSSSKARSLLDPTPYNHDVTVALAHEGMERVAQELSQGYVDTIMRTWGVKESTLRTMFMPQAREIAGRASYGDPLAEATKLMKEGYRPYDPESFRKFPTPAMTDFSGDRVWLPKGIIDNLEQIHNPKSSPLLKAMSPVTQVFRTSVLRLSPRFMLNNIVGGMFPILAEEGPAPFLKMVEARRIIKAVEAGDTSLLPDELRASLGSIRKESAEMTQFAKGAKWADVFRKIGDTRVAQGLSSLSQKGFDATSWVNDAYRVSAYLHGVDDALGKGLTKDAAEQAALELAHRTAIHWSDMTPYERNVIRQVFPFYGFTSKMIRFISRYPFDHPIRASVMANLGQTELADQGDGLGRDWMDSIGLGPVDSHGKQLQLSLKGLNPFADVADQFTLAGFLAGVNPVIKTTAEAAGLPVGGAAPFTPQTYDSETGRLTAATPGLLSSLVGNTVPQAQAVLRLAGQDPEYKALLRTNPDAAARLLRSGLGFPNTLRRVDVPAEYFKAELARESSARNALKQALSTGDFSDAEKYPTLKPLIEQLKALRAQGALTALNPTAGASTATGSVAAGAIPWPT